MRKKPVRKLLVACITGALFLPKLGFTLGLGDIEVNSALNQELRAEIELFSAAPEDAETLIVKLASREAFTRAGLDRPFLLNELRFKTVVVNNVPHIQVTTTKPVREPFLNFLLEIDWPKGHLLREYTVLLDPPTFMTQSEAAPVQNASQNTNFRPSATPAAAVVTPATNFRSTARPATVTSAKNNNVARPSPVRNPVSSQYRDDRYRIQTGDTAWSLAESMRPNSSVTVEQMMMALLHANPESFINENINGLKRGYILRTPDLADITAISPAQARAMVKEQAALWRQYRQSYSGGSPVSAVDNYEDSSAAGSQSSSEDASSQDSSSQNKGAHLQIVSAGSGASTSGTKDPTAMSSTELREALALARENLETERVEKELLHEEIEQLERQIGESKGLMTLEGGELASAQAGDAASNIADETSDDVSATELPADAGTENMDAAVADNEAMDAEIAAAEEAGMDGDVDGEAVFVDEAADDGVANDEAMASDSSSMEDAVEPSPAQPVGIVNSEPTDPLTRLMNDPMLLAAAGGGLLLILALGYLIVKRRKSVADDVASDEASTTTSLDDIADMVEEDQLEDAEGLDAESTVIMEAVDTSADTIVTDAFDEEEAFDEIVEEEEARDDVIAEADVYLAYGIYQQAEDLLENAITENPDRDDYRVKLAETRYASKNEAGFIETAAELRNRHPDEDTSAWKKVAAMGVILCPDNALFQGGAAADVDVDALAPQSPEPMDIDLGLDEELDIPDLDLSLDENDSVEVSEEGNDAILDIGDADDVFDVGSDGDVSTENETNEEAVIDLDLDEVEFDLSETDAVAENSAKEETSDQEFSLDIDASELDIDEDSEESETALESTSDNASEDSALEASAEADDSDESIEIDIDSAELDLDFGVGDETVEDSTEETSVDSLDLDFSAADETESTTDSDQTAASDEQVIDISGDDDSLDIDFGVDDDTTVSDTSDDTDSTVDENSIDLDAVDLDSLNDGLGDTSSDASSDTSDDTSGEKSSDDIMDDDEFDLSSLDDVDEISTKLDLARAYLDMGDSEGTREILKEVLSDGSNEQKKEAEELMGQLDG